MGGQDSEKAGAWRPGESPAGTRAGPGPASVHQPHAGTTPGSSVQGAQLPLWAGDRVAEEARRRCCGNRDAEDFVSLETGAQALLPWGLKNAVVWKRFPGDLEAPWVKLSTCATTPGQGLASAPDLLPQPRGGPQPSPQEALCAWGPHVRGRWHVGHWFLPMDNHKQSNKQTPVFP